MSRPSGAHTHDHGAELVGGLVAAVAVAALVEWILSVIWILAAAAGLILAGLVTAGWKMRQRYGRAPEVLPWRANAALPAPEARPLPARPAQALPAPQVVNNFNFYGVTAAQAAEVVARQRAITEGETDGTVR